MQTASDYNIGTADFASERETVQRAMSELHEERAVERIWGKDPTLWKPRPEDDVELSNRLGWLTLPEDFLKKVHELRGASDQAITNGMTSAVVCGMGGSSLAPEVFRITFSSPDSRVKVHVLDSTDPGSVRAVDHAIDPQHTLFLISSKSGGTLEVMSFLAHFWELTGGRGEQFWAITDPGTSLEKLARERGFGNVFLNPTEIGGRYSALSYFGLVPASLTGLDVRRLLESAAHERDLCRETDETRNPGGLLGVFFGGLARAGRDKLTLVTSPSLSSFGLWVEQLIAESTGKEGKGIVPVVGEPLGDPRSYGDDRCFVALRLTGDDNAALDGFMRSVKGLHPLLVRSLPDTYALGGEMFCWEFATAIAGSLLHINPFDQPNVQESKDNTARVLATHPATPAPLPLGEIAGFLDRAHSGDYVALQAYVTLTGDTEAKLQRLRARIRDQHRVATTLGFGPRFLHSTGQLHKGGPATGVFLQLTYDPAEDVPIPGAEYSFGTLLAAQALGDFQSLHGRGLRVARVHLGRDVAAGLDALIQET